MPLDNLLLEFNLVKKEKITEKEKEKIKEIYQKQKYPRSYKEMPIEHQIEIAIPRPFPCNNEKEKQSILKCFAQGSEPIPFNPRHPKFSEELWCEVFAAYLLMPDMWFEDDVKKGASIQEIAKKYKTEEWSVNFRLMIYYIQKCRLIK